MTTSSLYQVIAPWPFTRREGPWPDRAWTPSEKGRILRDNSQMMEDRLDEQRMFRWYHDVAGAKTDPRRKRKGLPHAFGVVPLKLTPAQYRKFKREFPGLLVLPRRVIRLPKQGRLTSTDQPVTSASQADFWQLDFLGVLSARQSQRVAFGRGVKIAVIDSGISELHSEFISKSILAINFDPKSGEAVTNNIDDTYGHGTHVSSLIAGSTMGVAPEADLLSLRVFPNGVATPAALNGALRWIYENHREVNIVNLSAGFPRNEAFEGIITQLVNANILVVCASGNVQAQCPSPGDYDAVLTVGACTRGRSLWDGPAPEGSGSGTSLRNSSVIVPDLLAPGAAVWGAWLGNQYRTQTGTSQAAPLVSGLAALEIEKRQKQVTVDQVVHTLMNRADPSPDLLRSVRGIAQV